MRKRKDWVWWQPLLQRTVSILLDLGTESPTLIDFWDKIIIRMWCFNLRSFLFWTRGICDIIYKNLIHSPRTIIMLITSSTNIQCLILKKKKKMLNRFNFVIIKGEGYRTIPGNSQPFLTREALLKRTIDCMSYA